MATTLGLLLQSALVFYIAFEPSNLAVLAVGAVAELVRPAALLFTTRPRGWREDWCFGAALCLAPPEEQEDKYVMMPADGF